MNEFKFKDCRDCVFVGRGSKIKECANCKAGENFEERIQDTLDQMIESEYYGESNRD